MASQEVVENLGVAKFFRGRSIFITGASGFMGKVLVEKLLRSCPGIVKIYVLLRPGRTGTIEEKMDKMMSFEVFDRLKSERPGDLESKLVAIEGNMTELGLGITVKDRALLIKEVSIVYHVAATVRFNQSLRDAIIMNVRGTREVCDLVFDIRTNNNPDAILLHVSTAYSHTDRKVVEEYMYPPHADWRRSIQIAEDMDEHTLQILCAKYTNGSANTYIFTKSLAEHVVNDLCGAGGCTIIVRPSVVISSAFEPVKGWIDNFNGPTAMLAAAGTGIVRIAYHKKDIVTDYITVDMAIKAIIVATWKQFVDKRVAIIDESGATVYNCTAYDTKKVSISEMGDIAMEIGWEVALRDTLWYPSTASTDNMTWYYINFMLFQLIPAIILDRVFKILGIKKQSLLDIQRKIYTATISLSYFTTNEWAFINTKAVRLEDALPSYEIETFGYDIDSIDVMEFFRNATLGAKRYLLKEDMSKLDRDAKRTKILYYMDKVVTTIFYVLLVWFFIFKIDIVNIVCSKLSLY